MSNKKNQWPKFHYPVIIDFTAKTNAISESKLLQNMQHQQVLRLWTPCWYTILALIALLTIDIY